MVVRRKYSRLFLWAPLRGNPELNVPLEALEVVGVLSPPTKKEKQKKAHAF